MPWVLVRVRIRIRIRIRVRVTGGSTDTEFLSHCQVC